MRDNIISDINIGPAVGFLSRVLSGLDTGVGPNFTRKFELPTGLETLVLFGPTQDRGDANDRPLRIVGKIKMPVRLGRVGGWGRSYSMPETRSPPHSRIGLL